MISEPSDTLCRPIPQYHMARKVAASTSGMVMPTTRPGRGSTETRRHSGSLPLRMCRPRLKKLTASTITTASIRVCTNSLTEVATALGWSCTFARPMPAGRVGAILSTAARRFLPSAITSPPLRIEMPSATVGRPW
ncbi:hypothetical protein D3C72_1936860 [compost metagenome]